MLGIPPKNLHDIIFSYSPDYFLSIKMQGYKRINIILVNFF